ncbi:MAG: hypothetical protein U1F65_09630 [Verrucomicrobiota bacterium]
MRDFITSIVWLFTLAACLFFSGCNPSTLPTVPLNETETEAAIANAPSEIIYRDEVKKLDRKGYEATKWIATTGNHAPFASNHFKSREEALAFIRSLYRLGATAVFAAHIRDEPERIKDEGGPYSDSLFVYLPSDRSRRKALFEVEAREAKSEGFAPTEDNGQDRFLLWWD